FSHIPRCGFFYAQNFTESPINKEMTMNQMTPIASNLPSYLPAVPEMADQSTPAAKRHLAAKRLMNTKNLDYQEWLEVRKQGIGSSDAAAACGLNPYMSMLELWMIKTGRSKQTIEDESSGRAP